MLRLALDYVVLTNTRRVRGGIHFLGARACRNGCTGYTGSDVTAKALTSANKSGKQSPIKTSEFKELWDQLAAIFDVGDLSGKTGGAGAGDADADADADARQDGKARAAAADEPKSEEGRGEARVGDTSVAGQSNAHCGNAAEEGEPEPSAKRQKTDGKNLNVHADAAQLSKSETATATGTETETEKAARQGSTVVDLSVEGQYRIIRQGIGFDQTVATLCKYGLVEAPAAATDA